MKNLKFKKIYCLPNSKIRENTNMKYFVFCGKNFDYYFSKKNKDKEIDIIKNKCGVSRI